ncbi:CidA/LrgA family protein [Paenibacillus sp. J2TS4]|uniref:CidA/LrgA family protein n=1 Tax=Paenibacillus sp. J2TS4 TaxID=2807194 RepID=UPI001B0E1F30|nr:CidA/LrgA family protein [Paenibacillus sp. J2TS4]GIP31621.1 CidA/LrgA family protein [Paenibacillus sp. J2TS4]
MLGIGILLGFNLLGHLLQSGFSLPLPGNVMGLLLFTLSLFLGWVKLEWVEQTSQFLLKHMMLFFAPIIVGSQVFFPLFREQWVTIGISWLGSTLMALLVTGWVAKGLNKKEHNDRAELTL